MKKCFKRGLIGAGAAGITAYGLMTAANEALFNRKIVFPDEFNQKMSGCDNSHLGEFLENNLKWLEEYGYERHFIVSDKGYRLTGYLMKPEKESDVFVFGAHGYRSSGKREFSKFVQYYLEKGYNVFFPDHVASGESEGLMCTFGYNEREDCMKWLTYLTDTFGKDIKIILHGVSMGCATVTTMGARDDLPENVRMIVADCGFTTAKALFESKLNAMGVPPKALISGVDFAHKRRHGYDFEQLRPIDSAKKIRLPILFVHGENDNLVPCSMVKELYEACPSENKDLLIVKGADHAQSYMLAKEEFEKKLDNLIEKI